MGDLTGGSTAMRPKQSFYLPTSQAFLCLNYLTGTFTNPTLETVSAQTGF